MVIGRRRQAAIAPIVVGVLALIAARSAMLPDIGFWDTAELQVVAPVMGTAHPTGFPTYVLSGWLANIVLTPFGEPAFRMNLFAGLCVALAAGLTVDLVRTLTRSPALGVLAGLGLALTPEVWAIGTRAEAHALHLVLLAILLRLLVGWEDAHRDRPDLADIVGPGPPATSDRWLVAAAAVFGLSMGNHSLTLLLALPIALFVLAVEPGIIRRPRLIVACAGALLLAMALVFLELPLRAGPFRAPLVYGRPETWDGFWYIVLAEQFRGSLIDPFGDLGAKMAALAARTAGEFGALAILIPAAFIATGIVRPRYALLTGSATVITVFFAASYENAEIGRYYLGPILMAWTWLAILAAAVVALIAGPLTGQAGAPPSSTPSRRAEGQATRRLRLDPPSLVAIVLAAILLVPTVLAVPATHAGVDARRETPAREWLEGALRAMEPDALVVSWWSYSTPLWYAQHVEGRRLDVVVVDDRTRLDQGLGDIFDVIDANLSTRPVYVIREDPLEIRELERRYILAPIAGPDARFLTRVIGPREAEA